MTNALDQIRSGKLFLIAGPCAAESADLCLNIAERLAGLCRKNSVPYVFKASFRKANRLAAGAYTGPGLEEGLRILEQVKSKVGVPVLTDVHETPEVPVVATVADIIQIPAFLCRQTDLVTAAGGTGKWVNIKKGQFLAPEDMAHIAAKTGSDKTMLTERGSSFGYRQLVVDFRSLLIMKESGFPVIFDATHSLQQPGGGGGYTTGQPQFIRPMARAAVAVGVDGLFIETHPDPRSAQSDAHVMLPLDQMAALLEEVLCVRRTLEEQRGGR